MENKFDYRPLYMFCKALERANKWKSSHYFIPTMSVIPGKFPAYKIFRIDVIEMDTSLGPNGIIQRFCEQQIVNSSGIISVETLYQETVYRMIEDLMQRMLEYYGTAIQ